MTCAFPYTESWSLIGSPSSPSASGQIANCTKQGFIGADSPIGEIVSKVAGMGNPSSSRSEMRCVLETVPDITVYDPLGFPCMF